MKRLCWGWFLLAGACEDSEGGSETDGGRSPVAEMCQNLEEAFDSCATGTTGSTTASGPSCEEVYADCTSDDLDLLNTVADCVEAACDDFTCYDAIAEVSMPCLGITTTSPSSSTTGD